MLRIDFVSFEAAANVLNYVFFNNFQVGGEYFAASPQLPYKLHFINICSYPDIL